MRRSSDYGGIQYGTEMNKAADHWDEEGYDHGGMYGLR
jgi:hypothetical protein